MARPSALSRRLSQALAPKVKDTRKFRLKKPMVFNPEQANILAVAFYEARDLSRNPKLTMAEFVVALAENLGGEVSSPDAQRTLEEVFVVQGGAAPTVIV